ncbi:ABC transporter [Candidatus Syntrophocurvum alkaliphilum]|uniref:ABC-type quaternary amine transporter n=1 Tax=Candidatus Syntrophocurvum alkaliphilum TaxID=2293317 RepID=A0A6I6DDF7_9FIRM|nr:ABC transporter ATP-binding protein [Candidatus Syntrophocurvum alkaliphilum]QGT98648.1 ABC transporter [Candidatus Syntrophocurvum alkaliphilum]
MKTVLQIKEVIKRYITEKKQIIHALDNINLEINHNDFVCLLGPSGCGKSTLLRMVAGLESITGGEIVYQGRKIQKTNRDIGMVFQEYSLFPWRSVMENVTVGLEFAGIKKAERQQIGENYLDLVGLSDFSNSYPYELSGGMQQRVAIARSLATDPDLLLMDEPFGALDAHTRILLQQELLNIWEKNKKTIIFVTHSVDEAVYLADKIVVMTHGPGKIKDIINVDMTRPRNRANPRYAQLTANLLDMLNYKAPQQDKVVNL